jgi:hypothetical protein
MQWLVTLSDRLNLCVDLVCAKHVLGQLTHSINRLFETNIAADDRVLCGLIGVADPYKQGRA